MRIEGLTTTPFGDRAVDRGLSAVLVAAVHHGGMAALANDAARSVSLSGSFAAGLLDDIQRRAGQVLHDKDAAERVRQEGQYRLDRWQQRRTSLAAGRLGYQEAADVAGLLRDPGEGGWDLWSTPRSLREVEPEVVLQLERRDASLDDAIWDRGSRRPALGRAARSPWRCTPASRRTTVRWQRQWRRCSPHRPWRQATSRSCCQRIAWPRSTAAG